MNRNRRQFSLRAVVWVTGAGLLARIVHAQLEPRVVPISAKRFEYTPNMIELKQGIPVLLELTSEDVDMGFSLPDFGLRADLLPGKVVRLPLRPDKVGKFTFFCDVFCGSGHEEMDGVMNVVA